MKVAYVGTNISKKNMLGGVGKKIKTQAKTWSDLGHPTRVFILSPDDFDMENGLVVQLKSQRKGIIGRFLIEIDRIKKLKFMISKIREFSPDIIYFRYGIYTYPLHHLKKISPIVVEINSLDIHEYKYRGFIYHFYNKITRSIIFNIASGFSTFANSVIHHPSISKYKKPYVLISNIPDISNIPQLPPANNSIPRVVFLGSSNYPWLGIDKLITLADLVSDIQIDVIGISRNELTQNYLPTNIHFYGFLPQTEYLEIIKNADVGISSLALHRIPLDEGSAIKTREYIAFGLPIILPHPDSNSNLMKEDWVLEIPNTEDNINTHYQDIREFIYSNSKKGVRVSREKILEYCKLEENEIKRLEFFEKIIEKDLV